MNDRLMFSILLFSITVFAAGQYVDPEKRIFLPEEEDLKSHRSPEWYNDAKLGIFIHWGLYSVPAYAPTKGSIREIMDHDRREWFKNNAYAEWYLNTLRIKGSPTYAYHLEHYGKGHDYYLFSRDFNKALKDWSPERMAGIFKRAGARYVVLTTKHHDGFTLWPSRVHNNNLPEACEPVGRDIVGELAEAVRAKGMRMGLYYSGGLDWTFNRTPIMGISPLWPDHTPQTAEYAAIADAHYRELIEKYKPDILWNDIYYPKKGDLLTILSDYYNLVQDGVINNRWGVPGLHDFTTPEYREYDRIVEEKWESCRGLGYSFGYNQYEDDSHTLSPTELIQLLVDVVSKNGNLLINVGPKPDGSIPEIQMERLMELGDWMAVNGEAIYDTHPWQSFGSRTVSGKDIRYTSREGKLYIHLFSQPGPKEVLPGLIPRAGTRVRMLGGEGSLEWKQQGTSVEVSFPGSPVGKHVFVLELSELPSLVINQ
jgi:alpha-L-fucosidase